MLYRIGEKPIITKNHREIENSEIIILPGVGSFDRAIKNLERNDLINIKKKKLMKIKILVCLGMQILYLMLKEGVKEGLKVFDVYCNLFNSKNSAEIFMGWSDIKLSKKN